MEFSTLPYKHKTCKTLEFGADPKEASLQVGVLGDTLSNASNVIRKGRLGPGQMVCADLSKGTFQNTQQLAKEVAAAHPYSKWLEDR